MGNRHTTEAISIINANIKQNILANGFTFSDIARHLGVSPSAVTSYFKSSIPTYRAKLIADYLGLTIDELISENKEPISKDATIAKCPYCGKYMRIETDVTFNIEKAESI